MSDKQLSEETKIKLIHYVGELLNSEKKKNGPYHTEFNKTIKHKDGFTNKTAQLIQNQTDIMNKQTDDLAELLGATEQKIAQIDRQYNTFKLANFVLIFAYYAILVGVKGLMLMQYLSGSVQRDEWVDTIMLTLLFVYPYIVYPIEAWIYELVTWIIGLVYNTTRIPDITTVVTSTDAYASPVDLDSKFVPTS